MIIFTTNPFPIPLFFTPMLWRLHLHLQSMENFNSHINDPNNYEFDCNIGHLQLFLSPFSKNQFTFIFHRRKGKLILTEIFPSVQKHDI